MTKPQVLFIINEVAHYSEFKKILASKVVCEAVNCQILFDRDGYDPEVLFSRQFEDCKKNSFSFAKTPQDAFFIPNNFVDRVIDKVEKSFYLSRIPFSRSCSFLIKNINAVFRGLRFYRKKSAYLTKFFHDQKIDVIVIGEENVLMDTFLYKTSAESRKVLVYPYTIPNPLEMMGGAFKSINTSSLLGKWTAIWSGRWGRKFGDKIYLLLSPQKIFSMLLFGYRPTNPWVLNSDTADVVCVESEKMADLYRQLEVPEKRLSIVGTLNDDILAHLVKNRDEIRANFLKKYNLSAEKPLIVSGFPPNQFPLRTAEHKSYHHMIECYANALAPYKERYSIIISKHPRIVDPLLYLKEVGFTIVDEATIDLIPLAYIYIGSASATIRWAISAGVPAINYDVYRHEYSDYNNLPAVKTVRATKDFEEALKVHLNDSEQYDRLKKLQLKDSKLWGNIDGYSGKRFVDQLIKAWHGLSH